MSDESTKSPTALKTSLRALAAGLAASPPGGHPTVVLEGKPLLSADLQAQLSTYADIYQAADDAYVVYQKAIAARDDIAPQAKELRDHTRAAVKAALGRKNPELAKYGITPDKDTRPLTTAEETAKVAKAKATRAARHTMGKKQKLAITGEGPTTTH
jgi:hypothetical protein